MSMWQFLEGAHPPPKKKLKQDKEERKEVSKIYERDKRLRKFNNKWKIDENGRPREWLTFDEDKSEMYCNVCVKHCNKEKLRNGPFVKGTSNFKLESVREHEKSDGHKRSSLIASAKTAAPRTTPAEKAIVALSKAETGRLTILFKSAHAIAKKGRPFTDFEWMCQLDQQKGLDIGETYKNRIQAKNFVHCIASVECEETAKLFKEAKFLAVLSDGSTDSAVVEEEIVYTRYAVQGQVKVRFVGIGPVQKPDAENITAAISSVLDSVLGVSRDDWRSKLVAIATDGAAVMTGTKSGVVTRIKGELEYVLQVHCMNHRLELSFRDAAKSNTCHKKLESLLVGLYNFYHSSPLNRANLKSSFATLGTKPLMPTRVGGTRWVGHFLKALGSFLKGYPAIVQHLEQIQSPDAVGVNAVQQAKARSFFKAATSLGVMRYANFLHDVLEHLDALSRKLQKTTLTASDVHSSLEATRDVLVKYKTRCGPRLQRAMESKEFGGKQLTGPDSESSRSEILDGMLASLEKRFGDLDTGVLHATSIMNLQSWPDKENMKDFGDEEVASLCNHFRVVLQKASVNVDRIPDEWTTLKSKVYGQGDWVKRLSSLTWPQLNRMLGSECQNVLGLFDLLLTIPSSTAECERGFNVMGQIKCDWRSSLSPSTLDDLMTVVLLAPEIHEFDPSEAINIWLSSSTHGRQPSFMSKGNVNDTDSKPEEINTVYVGVDRLQNLDMDIC